MKITIKRAMCDLREEFLSRIFEHYPDHQKLWKAEDVEKTFTTAMYDVACSYLDIIEEVGDGSQ